MPSRRRVLASVAGVGGLALAGCLSETPAGTDTATTTPTDTATPTETCSAGEPPAPEDAAAEPRSYPDRPSELTSESVQSFLETYESAYQYNTQLGEHPDMLGRTNDLSIYVSEVTVQSENGQFTGEVQGQLNWEIADRGTTTSGTPTETALPIGHRGFVTPYVVGDRELRRDGATVECW
jgi:hypothetical protein